MGGWLKVKSAAKRADHSDPRTVKKWTKMGLRHSRLPNGTILIKPEWLDQFLESFEVVENEVEKITDEIMKEVIADVGK